MATTVLTICGTLLLVAFVGWLATGAFFSRSASNGLAVVSAILTSASWFSAATLDWTWWAVCITSFGLTTSFIFATVGWAAGEN